MIFFYDISYNVPFVHWFGITISYQNFFFYYKKYIKQYCYHMNKFEISNYILFENYIITIKNINNIVKKQVECIHNL